MEIKELIIDDIDGSLYFNNYDSNDPIMRDTKLAVKGVLVHTHCFGFIDIKKISKDYNAIVCRACKMRIPFPNTIKTYGELKNYLKKRKINWRKS